MNTIWMAIQNTIIIIIPTNVDTVCTSPEWVKGYKDWNNACMSPPPSGNGSGSVRGNAYQVSSSRRWHLSEMSLLFCCTTHSLLPLSLPNWQRLFSSPGSIRHHHQQVPHVHPVGLQEQEQHVWRWWWWLRPGKGRKILVLVYYYYYYRSESNPNGYNKFGILFYLNS